MLGSAARILVLLCLGTGAGLAYNAGFARLPWAPQEQQLEKESTEKRQLQVVQEQKKELRAREVSAADMMRLAAKGAIIIDARDPADFAEGHLDVPTIINVPPEQVLDNLERLSPPLVLERPFVLYCNSDDCEMAEQVFVELKSQFGYGADGLNAMYIYYPGWAGIQKEGLPTASDGERWVDSYLLLEQQMSAGDGDTLPGDESADDAE